MKGWFIYQANGDPVGPMPTEMIAQGLVDGKVGRDAFVASEGDSQWQQITKVAELVTAARKLQNASTQQEGEGARPAPIHTVPPAPPPAATAVPPVRVAKLPAMTLAVYPAPPASSERPSPPPISTRSAPPPPRSVPPPSLPVPAAFPVASAPPQASSPPAKPTAHAAFPGGSAAPVAVASPPARPVFDLSPLPATQSASPLSLSPALPKPKSNLVFIVAAALLVLLVLVVAALAGAWWMFLR